MKEMPIKILLVEDNPADAELIQHMLAQASREDAQASSFGLECADLLSTALERLAAGGIDAVLLDLSLPDSQGLMAFTKVHTQAAHTPVIVLSGMDDEALAVEAVRQGAQDYLVKGHVDGFSLARAIRHAVERKQAESQRETALEALRKERDFTFAVLDTLSALVIVLDSEGRIVRFNHACEEMTGYSGDEAIGKYIWDLLLLPEDVEPIKVVFRSLLTGVLSNQHENYLVAEDGERRLIAWSNTAIRDQQGRVEYIIGTGVDITRRRQAEQELRQASQEVEKQNARLKALYRMGQAVNSTLEPDSILDRLTDEAMRVTRATHGQVLVVRDESHCFERRSLRGFSPEEAQLARTLPLTLDQGVNGRAYMTHQTVRIDDVQTEPDYFRVIPATRAELVVPIIHDGQVLANLDLQSPEVGAFRDADLGYLNALADQVAIGLTNARAFYAVEQSGRDWEATFNAMQDPVALLDRNYRIVRANQAFVSTANMVNGRLSGAVEQAPGETLLGGVGCSQPKCPLSRTMETGEAAKCLHEHGGRLFDVQTIPVWEGDRRESGQVAHMVYMMRDITEAMRAEEELEKAKEIAEAATRAKSEFLANMSHEIRTPMNVIIGMTSLALKTDLVTEQRDYLNAVRNSSESLLGLLNDILDFSKIEAGRLELEETSLKLQEVLEQTADVVAQRAAEKGLELIFHIHPEVPAYLRGDPLRLRQVLVNLVGNAIKFTEQGEIVVQISLSAEEDDMVELLCSIADTGIGIPADKLAVIFDSFSQADGSTTRRYGGTGLGLAISKQLVRMMGGSIWVESQVGQGSTFYFTALLKREPNPQESAPVASVSIQDWRALVIDDNSHNRHILHAALRSFGCRPEMARDGAEGLWMLERALETGDPFELVLLDVQMPGMDGFEALRVIRQTPQLQSMVVIMLTSVDSLGKVANCPELGWSAYLTKPVKQSQLFDTILEAIGRAAVANKAVQFQPEERPGPPPVSLRILLAEDNELNAHLARVLLEQAGHQVVLAENGEVALDLLAQSDVDMVFMDVQMPGMDGLETTAAIRANPAWAHLPIIAMTAHAMKGDRERCLEAGMNDYISKPLCTEEVLAAIERQLGTEGERRSQVPAGDAGTADDGSASAVLDRAGALSRLGDDEVMFDEFLLLLLDGAESDVAELGVAVEAQDALGIERLAHGLKGGAASLGADRVRDAAYRLETIGRSGDLADARSALARLQEELSRLRGLVGEKAASNIIT
jgi:two-component system sensor histidine kinase/response regulator